MSMGSFLSVSSAQIDEIATGLRDSGVRFLWVARDEIHRLKEICGHMRLVMAGPGVSPASPWARATPLHGATTPKKKFSILKKKKKIVCNNP
jgi:hypothetical protein